jgi:hypothetical protein
VARKILFYETGPAEVLKIVEAPAPEPGAGENGIRVKANDFFILPTVSSWSKRQSGHFYFALTGHSHFAATTLRL